MIIYFPLAAQEGTRDAPSSMTPPPAAQNDPDETGIAGDPAPGLSEGIRFPGEDAIVLGDDEQAAPVQWLSSVGVVFRMVLALALAALAIYGVVFFIKRLSRPPENRSPHLKILASVPLGSGAFAAVLSVGSKAWLVAGGDGGVNLVSEITEAEALESMLIDDASKDAASDAGRFPDFRSLLRKFGGKGRGGGDSGGVSPGGEGNINVFDSHTEALRRQRGRLKGL